MKTISRQDVSPVQFRHHAVRRQGRRGEERATCMPRAARRGSTSSTRPVPITAGASEEIARRICRGRARRHLSSPPRRRIRRSATPEVIHREFAESRERLGIETVDLLYIHQPDPVTPLEVTLGAVAEYVEAGAVRHVGLSNFSAWATMKARGVARELGIDVTFLQPMYNLVKRQAEVEILPMAVSEGFAVCPYSPLGGGLLTGKYAPGEGGRIRDDAMYSQRYGAEWMYDAARGLNDIGRRDWASIRPRWLWPGWRGTRVSGGRSSRRGRSSSLRPSLEAIGFAMDDALYARVSALSPTPPPANDRFEEA